MCLEQWGTEWINFFKKNKIGCGRLSNRSKNRREL